MAFPAVFVSLCQYKARNVYSHLHKPWHTAGIFMNRLIEFESCVENLKLLVRAKLEIREVKHVSICVKVYANSCKLHRI